MWETDRKTHLWVVIHKMVDVIFYTTRTNFHEIMRINQLKKLNRFILFFLFLFLSHSIPELRELPDLKLQWNVERQVANKLKEFDSKNVYTIMCIRRILSCRSARSNLSPLEFLSFTQTHFQFTSNVALSFSMWAFRFRILNQCVGLPFGSFQFWSIQFILSLYWHAITN